MKEYLEVDENRLKAFLIAQSEETLTDSYLSCIDILSASVEDISDTLISVARLTATLKKMIDNGFKSTDGVKVLRPQDRTTQDIVTRDYYDKKAALRILLSNIDVRNAFSNRIKELNKGSKDKKASLGK